MREACAVCGEAAAAAARTWETGMLLCAAHALAWTRSEEKWRCRLAFEAAVVTNRLPDFEVKVVTNRLPGGKEETKTEPREGGTVESVPKTPEKCFALSFHFLVRVRRSESRLGFFWRWWYGRAGWTIPWKAP